MIYHKERLDGVHPALAAFIERALEKISRYWPDWLIVCGWRGQAEQHAAFTSGHSAVDWPNSKHNYMIDGKPASLAVDIAPHPYDAGKDVKRLYLVAGFMLGLAAEWQVNLRLGADWDGDLQTTDQKLADPWHFELWS